MTRLRTWPGAVALLLIAGSGVVGQEADPLAAALRNHAYTFELRDGRLEGEGGELLLTEGRRARFFLIGEEHGVAEIPEIASALFRALAPAGYRHLAIEVGDGLAERLEEAAREPDPVAGLVGFYSDHWPGAPFYVLRTEAQLLVDAVAAAGEVDRGGPDTVPVLWGLDYDIMADRHALERLAELATTRAEAEAVERTRARADSAMDRALAEGNPGHFAMFGAPPEWFSELRSAFDPAPGTEAVRILDQLEETLAINRLFVSGQGWRSNQRRAEWNKRQLGRFWDRAASGGDDGPRVMFKFGATHVMRGRTFTDVYDLGTVASALADARGETSFHVMMIGGPGTRHAVMDPTVLEYVPAPVGIAGADWAAAFVAQADPERWTLYDLRPLRPLAAAGRLGTLASSTEKVIHGYDALVVLSGSTPNEALALERR